MLSGKQGSGAHRFHHPFLFFFQVTGQRRPSVPCAGRQRPPAVSGRRHHARHAAFPHVWGATLLQRTAPGDPDARDRDPQRPCPVLPGPRSSLEPPYGGGARRGGGGLGPKSVSRQWTAGPRLSSRRECGSVGAQCPWLPGRWASPSLTKHSAPNGGAGGTRPWPRPIRKQPRSEASPSLPGPCKSCL